MDIREAASVVHHRSPRQVLLSFIQDHPTEVYRISDLRQVAVLTTLDYNSLCEAARFLARTGVISKYKFSHFCFYGTHDAISKLQYTVELRKTYPLPGVVLG